jgi:hypothetical protein
MKRHLTTFALLLSLAGCGGGDASGGDGGVTGANHPLSGMINGMAWTGVAGQTDSFLSMNEPTYFTTIFEVPIDSACSFPSASDRQVILRIPKTLGNHPITFDMNATLSYYVGNNTTENKIATSGYINVTEVTATTIRGSAKVPVNAANTVEGTFEVAICP